MLKNFIQIFCSKEMKTKYLYTSPVEIAFLTNNSVFSTSHKIEVFELIGFKHNTYKNI